MVGRQRNFTQWYSDCSLRKLKFKGQLCIHLMPFHTNEVGGTLNSLTDRIIQSIVPVFL